MTGYSYDFTDQAFLQHCEHLSGLCFALIGSKRFYFILDYTRSKADFLEDIYFRYAQEVEHVHESSGLKYRTQQRYTDRQMDDNWLVVEVQREKLQRLWGKYRDWYPDAPLECECERCAPIRALFTTPLAA